MLAGRPGDALALLQTLAVPSLPGPSQQAAQLVQAEAELGLGQKPAAALTAQAADSWPGSCRRTTAGRGVSARRQMLQAWQRQKAPAPAAQALIAGAPASGGHRAADAALAPRGGTTAPVKGLDACYEPPRLVADPSNAAGGCRRCVQSCRGRAWMA